MITTCPTCHFAILSNDGACEHCADAKPVKGLYRGGPETFPADDERTGKPEPEGCTFAKCILDGHRVIGVVGQDVELAAHHAGDGWWIGAENLKGEVVCHLAWPGTWPDTINASFLRTQGFKIV